LHFDRKFDLLKNAPLPLKGLKTERFKAYFSTGKEWVTLCLKEYV